MVAFGACAPGVTRESSSRSVVDLSCGFNLPIYMAVGDTLHLHAAKTDVYYDVLTCVDSFVPGHHWQSPSPAVVSVDSEGFARALSPGRVELSTETSLGPAHGSVIVLPALTRFGFGRDSVVIPVDVYTDLSVDPQDSAGNHLYPLVLFRWSADGVNALGGLASGGGPGVSVDPSHEGRAYLVARMGTRADSILVIASSVIPADSASSVGIYNAVLEIYARYPRVTMVSVEDSTSLCMDMALPQWAGLMDTASRAMRDATADCTRRAKARVALPFGQLRASKPIALQSQPERPEASIETPVLFLSRPGISADGTRAVIDVNMYCGGPVCASDVLYWFRRTASGWEEYASWGLGES